MILLIFMIYSQMLHKAIKKLLTHFLTSKLSINASREKKNEPALPLIEGDEFVLPGFQN